jgi:hypothetical protein
MTASRLHFQGQSSHCRVNERILSNLVCHFNESSKNFDFDFFQQQGGINKFRKLSTITIIDKCLFNSTSTTIYSSACVKNIPNVTIPTSIGVGIIILKKRVERDPTNKLFCWRETQFSHFYSPFLYTCPPTQVSNPSSASKGVTAI